MNLELRMKGSISLVSVGDKYLSKDMIIDNSTPIGVEWIEGRCFIKIKLLRSLDAVLGI